MRSLATAALVVVTPVVLDRYHLWVPAAVLGGLVGVWAAVAWWLGCAGRRRDEGDRAAMGVYFQDGWGR